MARQIIGVGTAGNDGTGDDLRTGANKINQNFQDLYSQMTALSLSLSLSSTNSNGIGFGFNGILFDGATKDSFSTVTRLIPSDPTQINIQSMQDSSGTLAFLSDITRIINRDKILGIRGGSSRLLDSATAIDAMFAEGFLDSARAVRISLDSADVTAYIDAAYIQARQNSDFLDSNLALQFLMSAAQTDSAINNNPTLLAHDSDITALQNTLGGTSDNMVEGTVNLFYTTARHDSDTLVLVDSAYVNARVADAPNALDSAEGQAMIESNLGAVNQDLVPLLDSVYDLGSPTKKWKDLHLSGNTIFLGGGTISYDNNEYSFGNGSLKTEQAISMDSGQRLFFANGGANITHSQDPQANSLMVNANTVTLRTVDDGKPGWYIKTNSPSNGAFSVMGNAGLVMLPHNTTTNRTQYSTNAFYEDDYRKGAIHYNTTVNKFEFADSDGWFSVDRDAVSAVATNAQYVQFGYDATIAGSGGAISVNGIDGASILTGIVMPVAGTVTNVTVSSATTAHSGGSLTHSAAIYKNNSYQTGISTEVTSSGNISLTGTVSVSFNAGDRLKITIDNDTGMDTANHNVIVRFVES